MPQPRKPRAQCLNCGWIVLNPRSKCCTLACHRKAQYKRYIERWLAGEANGSSAEGQVSKHVRRWLFERAGDQCERCGWSRVHPVTGKIPLTVNHIDGDSNNHRPENLELLCGACHTLTPNYGKLNNGRGRKTRREKLQSQAKGM